MDQSVAVVRPVSIMYGMTKAIGGKLTMINVTRYTAEQVNPPERVKSEDWIKSGFVH